MVELKRRKRCEAHGSRPVDVCQILFFIVVVPIGVTINRDE